MFPSSLNYSPTVKSSKEHNISFGRELKPVETIENRLLIKEAKHVMGIDNIALITHTPSLPTTKEENTGIGILALTNGTKSYLDFAYNNGINALSVEPSGIIKAEYYCPYDASAFSKKAIVDLKALTDDDWANILPDEEFKKAVNNKDYNVQVPIGDKKSKTVEFKDNQVIYDYALNAHKKALNIAFNNFEEKVKAKDSQAIKLNEEFSNYKKENDFWLSKDALYLTLSDLHGSDSYSDWDNELHKELFNEKSGKFSKEKRTEEVERLTKENNEAIEFNKFSQFVVSKQQVQLARYAGELGNIKASEEIEEVKKALQDGEISKTKQDELIAKIKLNAKNSRIAIVGDKPVGFSTMDIWANQDLFSKDEFMGAPPDMFSDKGQAWGFRFISRDKLFNKDGSLGDGGELLKGLFKKTFKENPGGVRIDHVLGIIDPWTYTDNVKEGSRYLFKLLLSDQLKELKQFNINEETIKGVKDPVDAILNPRNKSRAKLKANLKKSGLSDNDINRSLKFARKVLYKQEPLIKKEYSKTLNDIVMKAAIETLQEQSTEKFSKEQLKDKARSMIICEDLGVLTVPLQEWTLQNSGLCGMRMSRYSDPLDEKHIYREGNPKEQGNYWSLGTHDDAPYISQLNSYKPEERINHSKYIASELGINSTPLEKDTLAFIRAKFARMMAADKKTQTPNNILVMWNDLLGKNIRFNTPGIQDKEKNWTARIDMDSFNSKLYNEILPSGQGINITEALATAMKSMDAEFKKTNQKLINSLEKFADIINEKPE